MSPPAPRPHPDVDHVREAMADLAANEEPETPSTEEGPETDEPAGEPDEAAEELDLDLPPNESAPGHNPDSEDAAA